MIRRLVVQNFRSLEEVILDLDPLTALVGPNGSGKSAILRAIDLVLGRRWPTIDGFRLPHDYTRCDHTAEMRIRVRVDPSLAYADALKREHAIHGFEVRVAPYMRSTRRAERGDLRCDFTPLADNGKPPLVALNKGKAGPNFGPLLNVPAPLRDEAGVLFIDHRRSVVQHQPWARGSVLARLLASARRDLDEVELEPGLTYGEAFSERYQRAVEALRTPRSGRSRKRSPKPRAGRSGFSGARSRRASTCASGSRTRRTPSARSGSSTGRATSNSRRRRPARASRAPSSWESSKRSGSSAIDLRPREPDVTADQGSPAAVDSGVLDDEVRQQEIVVESQVTPHVADASRGQPGTKGAAPNRLGDPTTRAQAG